MRGLFAVGSIAVLMIVGSSAQAQVRELDACGSGQTARADGTIGSMIGDAGALSIIPRGPYRGTCSKISAIRYTGARFLLSDCKVGRPFMVVGGLRANE